MPMTETNTATGNRIFVLVFCVLTIFCWCPLGYGYYGPAKLFLGIPSWAAIALAIGIFMFVVEWIYLFTSDLAINDKDLPEIISQLESVTE